jgi:hypothetical protein
VAFSGAHQSLPSWTSVGGDDVYALHVNRCVVYLVSRLRVVATSGAPLAWPRSIRLDPFRGTRANVLAASIAPRLEPWQAAAVATMAGGRPGLIRKIVDLLGRTVGHLDLFDIWYGLQTRPSAVFELLDPTRASDCRGSTPRRCGVCVRITRGQPSPSRRRPSMLMRPLGTWSGSDRPGYT